MTDERFVEQLTQHWQRVAKRDRQRELTQPKPLGALVQTDRPYIAQASPLQKLNLYFPKNVNLNTEKLPTIIDIHGGGWMYGDCHLNDSYCLFLASQGYAVMAMSYRLLPQVGLKEMIEDVFASLHWLELFGSQKGFDLTRVLLVGDSAGGHLAGLTLCIQRSPKLQLLYGVEALDFDFDAAVIICGVMEPQKLALGNGIMSRAAKVQLKLLTRKNTAIANAAGFSQACRNIKLPPLMIIGSEEDSFWWQTRLFLRTLTANKLDFQTKLWRRSRGKHLGHVFNVTHWEWSESRETNFAMLNFFKQISASKHKK
ncbi:esterase lipase [Liquorilactobacillus sucicola DSM 21376 = JCM 15457]|uniref:Esterase lipase n=1 Tax=Liquorilactobacillus sucicola DSM 21376 = JCM 15457 TaxID=1423806 RepID=A0A0R2DPP4_9LACO|nr:alpha/beta hydrolase [Liquorilactobacillus sucicola]KRN05558.1 esterase lipase [Liquorilactobacillus sucicola DSM 21376 = JCM 15457]